MEFDSRGLSVNVTFCHLPNAIHSLVHSFSFFKKGRPSSGGLRELVETLIIGRISR